jgi:multiple sugar transport system substrate-binding protein
MLKKSTVIILTAAMLAGCGGAGSGDKAGSANNNTPEKQEPVTLKFYARTALDDFDKYVNNFVKKKFPHVTLEYITAGKGQAIEDFIAAGTMPDIIWEGLSNIQQLTQLDVPMDLTELAKKQKLDLSVYTPKVMNAIKAYAPKEEVYFLPYNDFVLALHYNKDIFDKFAVPYPKNNPTWEEIIEIGKKLTRTEGTVNYLGLKTAIINRVTAQMNLSYINPTTKKSNFQDESWRKFFEFYRSAMYVPNQVPIKAITGARTEFLNNHTLAMFPDHIQLQNTDMVDMEAKGLRWDVVTYPMFKDKPNIGPSGFVDGFVIPKGTKHADIAFQVVSYLSSDPAVQLEATKNGRITALKDTEIKKHAFEYNPAAKGKNLANVVINYSSENPTKFTEYDKSGNAIATKKVLDYILGKSDLNTILRQAEEEHNKEIDALNAAKK